MEEYMLRQMLRLILLSYGAIILGAVLGLIIWVMLCAAVSGVAYLAGHFVSSFTIQQFTNPIYSAAGYFWCSTIMTAVVIYRMKDRL